MSDRISGTASADATDSAAESGDRTEDGVDYAWVMQTTFVIAIVLGAPLVAALSLAVPQSTWALRAEFAAGVGGLVWIVVAVVTFGYEWRYRR